VIGALRVELRYIVSKRWFISILTFLAILLVTQVNDVRRETAGSRRFPVNSGDHIQNWFLCPFPAYFQPRYGAYPAVYGIRILWQSIILGSHALTMARHMPIQGDINWFLDLLIFLMVFSQFFQLKSLFSPNEKFIQPTGNTSKHRKAWKTIEIQRTPIQSIRKTSKITEISRN
jgi:hypothetical protein